MIIDVLVPHYDRLTSLRRCLSSLHWQTEPAVRRIIVLDDSPEARRQEIRFVAAMGKADYLGFEFRGGKPQWSKKFNQGKTTMDLHGPPYPDAVAIVSCDFRLGDDFFCDVRRARIAHGEALLVAPGLNRHPGKAMERGGPIRPGKTPYVVLEKHDWADNGMCWVLPWDKWLPWDEEFDEIGFGHQVPEWLYRLKAAGTPLVRCDAMKEHHFEHDYAQYGPDREAQVMASAALYEKKIGRVP